jgi:PAS domain S-box-containing protein
MAIVSLWARVRLRLLTWLVLVVMAGVSLAAFAVIDDVVDDQDRRLLSGRADEVEALLASSIDALESSLRALGPVGASSDAAARALFARSAGGLIEGNAKTIGVAANRGGGFSVVAAVGDGPAVGEVLTGERASLAARALAFDQSQLVSALLQEEGETRLMLARRVEGRRAVAYRESLVDPSRVAPSTPDSPFRELRVALYAAPRAEPDQLVVTTEAEVPLTGRVERLPFSVGGDQWLLVVGEREPLAGSLARNVPWFVLYGGLVVALLVAAIIETLLRRRAYAMTLVAGRTRDLEAAMVELGEATTFIDRLITALPVLITRVSVDESRLTYVSPNVERVLGTTAIEALAPGFLDRHIHPEDLPEVQAGLARGVTNGVTESLEFRFRRAEDSHVWLSAVGVPDLDDAGKITGLFFYAWDVSDRRLAEAAQREAQAAAEAANRAKSEFLSRMSHELRTPLNAVLGFGQLLETEPLSDTQRDSVDHILKGGRHLLDLINEVLDISRIETGDLAMSPEPVLLSELVPEVIALIRPLAEQRGIQVVIDRPEGCAGYAFADRQRVKQVLLNLLSNAVKYNRPRGTVAVSCEPSDSRFRINVADTGMGIPAERLGLLFTPFERLGAENSGEEGTGIGLALSQRLAEAMGGELTVVTTLGRGSTFTVDLPRVEGPVERYERLAGGTGPTVEPASNGHMVLHIEDNLSNLTLIERVLAQRAGVDVIAAMQGRLGLELAREHQPVLVLLDLHLPDMDGAQVLQRLRDDPATSSIPVAIVSADATPGQVQRLLSAGAVAYLTKPIDVREVLRLLDDAVSDR